jgi:pSer/pThr/pTyr-binding forkhead associated (FHA) protein
MHVRFKTSSGKEIKIPTPKCVIGREGREEGVHLQLNNDDAVSRKHCAIITTENEVLVRDLKSRNGTFVNEERVAEEAVLLSGDVLKIGRREFELVIEHSNAKPKRPKVADIKEAVARTAEVGGGGSSTSDLEDVTSWLDEADTQEKSRRTTDPETRQFRLDDTVAPATATAEAAAKPNDSKTITLKRPDKKEPGKLPPQSKTTKADSREAAADMLKKFFNRR